MRARISEGRTTIQDAKAAAEPARPQLLEPLPACSTGSPCSIKRSSSARSDAPVSAADPVDDEAAVFVRCLLPGEVTGLERVDLAVREEVVEVLVVRPRHELIVAP